MREMFDNEWLPFAFSIGLTREQFYKCTMRTLNAYIKGDKMRKVERDAFDYRQGQYFLSALQTALDHAFNGKKAQSKYVEKPFLSDLLESNGQNKANIVLTEEEKQRQIDIFVMKRKIGKHNYDLVKELEGK